MNDGKIKNPEHSGEDGSNKFNPEYDPLSDMRGDLDELHLTYSRNSLPEIRKRKIVRRSNSLRKTHVRTGSIEHIPPRLNFYIKGLEQFQIRFKSEDFASVDSNLRLLLAVGDSNHRVNSSSLGTPDEKRSYLKDIINLGQRLVLTEEGLSHMIDTAVEQGTIYLDEESTAQLTEGGLEAIESADSIKFASRGQGFNFD